MTRLRAGLPGLLPWLTKRQFPLQPDIYLRVDKIYTLVEALKSLQHSTEVCEQRVAACEQRLETFTKTMETKLSSLKTMLQPLSVGSQEMIPRELVEAIAWRVDHANARFASCPLPPNPGFGLTSSDAPPPMPGCRGWGLLRAITAQPPKPTVRGAFFF